MTLYDYVRLFQREWRWGIRLFIIFCVVGSFGVFLGYLFLVPREGYVATAMLIVSDKDRTLAQLNSRQWAQMTTILKNDHVKADLTQGLVRLQVESVLPNIARVSAERLLALLQQTRRVEREERTLALTKAMNERLNQYVGQKKFERLQDEIQALNVEVVDPPTVRTRPSGHKPWISLIAVAIVALVVSVPSILVREWWRLENEQRGRIYKTEHEAWKDMAGVNPIMLGPPPDGINKKEEQL